MEVGRRFRGTIKSVFMRLGVEGEYWPADGSPPTIIRVINRSPEKLYEIGEAQILSEDPQLEFQSDEVESPRRGDDIHLNGEIYRLDSEPTIEQHQLVWVANCIKL